MIQNSHKYQSIQSNVEKVKKGKKKKHIAMTVHDRSAQLDLEVQVKVRHKRQQY